jgi:hypothetical protein
MKTLFLFFIFSILIYGQSHDTYYQWKDMNYNEKMLYVEGISEGIPLGGMFSTYLLNKSERKKPADSYNYCVNEYLTNVTIEQLCEGLDSLYTDYRNQTISINYGVWAVLCSIRGIPKEAYEELLQALRKGVLP